MDWEETKAFLSRCLPEEVQAELELLYPWELRELRVRANRDTVFCTVGRTTAIPWRPTHEQVEALAEALSEHGLYARGEETRQGYVTLRGGHRMGLCGRVQTRNGGVRALRAIGSVCIRIAGQWPGAADAIMPLLRVEHRPMNVLLVGVPGSGKTTLLRDATRQLASGRHALQVSLIDERGELAACVNGVPQLDVGEAVDVLDGCPKASAVRWLTRSMTPQVIVTDELSGAEDVSAVMEAMACGIAVVASVHGKGLNELASRPVMAALMSRRCFDAYVVLSPEGGGQIAAVYDKTGAPLHPDT